MRKLFLGLIVAGAAFGTSAFTSAAPKTHAASVYYVLTSAGTYVRTATVPSTGNCQEQETPACWIAFATDKGESILVGDVPTEEITEQSETNGLYIQ